MAGGTLSHLQKDGPLPLQPNVAGSFDEVCLSWPFLKGFNTFLASCFFTTVGIGTTFFPCVLPFLEHLAWLEEKERKGNCG